MFEASEIVFAILNGYQPLLDLGVEIQPIISDEETNYPFVNYVISESGKLTKDNGFTYSISIQIYSKKYNVSCKIADAIKDAFGAAEQYFKYEGTNQPQANVFGEMYTESNYQFKK